jgi:hypothetical protein
MTDEPEIRTLKAALVEPRRFGRGDNLKVRLMSGSLRKGVLTSLSYRLETDGLLSLVSSTPKRIQRVLNQGPGILVEAWNLSSQP